MCFVIVGGLEELSGEQSKFLWRIKREQLSMPDV